MLGVLDGAADRSGEGGSGRVAAIHDEQRLGNAAAGHLGHRRLEQGGEHALSSRRRVHHAAQLDLVGAVAVDAEEPDDAARGGPHQVVDLVVGPGPERPPFELEPTAVHCDAGRGELLDAAQLLGWEAALLGAEPARRSFQPAAPAFCSSFGSFGSPRTRSATMLRWIWAVPPQIVSEREKKKLVCSALTG